MQFAMSVNVSQIMRDDSLAAKLFQGHDYNRSLVGDSIDAANSSLAPLTLQDDNSKSGFEQFFDNFVDYLSSLPGFVYIIFGVVLAALLVYWIACSGLFYHHVVANEEDLEEGTENIYEVDIDGELAAARQRNDHAAIVRLIYLRTLRSLDESDRIDWRIYKTPSQFARELPIPQFVTMTNYFLRVRYGKFPATQTMCDEMETLGRELLKGGEA